MFEVWRGFRYGDGDRVCVEVKYVRQVILKILRTMKLDKKMEDVLEG